MDTRALVITAQTGLAAAANDGDARSMQAYMKTTMPFYGVKAPARAQVFKSIKQSYAPNDSASYLAAIEALWALPHREEKYLALDFAAHFKKRARPEDLSFFARLIREGAWWDLVDAIVMGVVSPLYKKHREALREQIVAWLDDDDVWIRRASMISQLKHKSDTDEDELFAAAKRLAHEREFFIRKAIGWALREYSKVAPERVLDFVDDNKDILSGLSQREATRRALRALGR